jgi:hypothetical protein
MSDHVNLLSLIATWAEFILQWDEAGSDFAVFEAKKLF